MEVVLSGSKETGSERSCFQSTSTGSRRQRGSNKATILILLQLLHRIVSWKAICFPSTAATLSFSAGTVRFSALTSSAVVHGAADPRAHRSKSSHCEVGDVSGLKRQNIRVKIQKFESLTFNRSQLYAQVITRLLHCDSLKGVRCSHVQQYHSLL